ncbi:MAG: AraC family transcriptional regulator [Pseudomonadota bacterium]
MTSSAAPLHLWKPGSLPGVTLLRADGMAQTFARHTHDDYALGVITRGALGFDYMRGHEVAAAGEINLVVPGEPHSGRPAQGDSWGYRMFYVEPGVLRQALPPGQAEAAFDRGVIRDPVLAHAIVRLHRDLEDGADASPLEVQSRLLALLAHWVRRHAQADRRAARAAKPIPEARRAHDYLEAHWRDKPTLEQLAQLEGLSAWQLLRAFVRQHGLPPHAWLVQRQVREARRLLEAGLPIAEAAQAAGFADQSHLNRHFKRMLGLTPGQYRACLRG